MGERTAIAWTDHTFNPWIGCQQVSPGCENCYAEAFATRRGLVAWGPGESRRRTAESNWKQPARWNRQAERDGRNHLVFCASLADVFDNEAPQGAREDLWELIRQTPRLTWQILTKRPQNMEQMRPDDWKGGYPNVWLGITAENQQEYDRRWPALTNIPVSVRFISYEPALGALEIRECQGRTPDWLIWGGESGPGARPMDPRWAAKITLQCLTAGIAVFGKQWGSYDHHPLVRYHGMKASQVRHIDPPENGKGGAMLAGTTYRQFPVQFPVHSTPNSDIQ